MVIKYSYLNLKQTFIHTFNIESSTKSMNLFIISSEQVYNVQAS